MGQNIYLLSDKSNKSAIDSINNQIFVNGILETENLELTNELLVKIAKATLTEYFYVISTRQEIIFDNFDFSFKPKNWDKAYIHIWNNNSTVRLFNKKCVLENPDIYSDKALTDGISELKNIDKRIYKYPLFDIIFLSYNELHADENYGNLKLRFPRIKRVNGIKGIYEAHIEGAKLSQTEMFYVVDADAYVLDDFNFDFQPEWHNNETVHVWYSQNPINDLIYGYGGIKLFPKTVLLNYNGSPVDFTTSVSKHVNVIPKLSCITYFNTDPFSTWRSAFRECAKLASKLIPNQNNNETEERLRIWCTVGNNSNFGNFAIDGANKGKNFGLMYANQPEILKLINDYEWLKEKFNS